MNPLEKLRAREAELRTALKDAYDARGKLLDGAVDEKRGLNKDEETAFSASEARSKALEAELRPITERIAEMEAEQARSRAADEALVRTGGAGAAAGAGEERSTSMTTVTDPAVYIRGNKNGNSYFRDLAKTQAGAHNPEARERLARHAKALEAEKRALGNTNATGGSGGEFAPPLWLVSDWINLARPGRVTADLFQHSEVPPGVSSVSLPKILTGTAVGLQSTQNSALAQTDMTTGSVSTGFSTLGGKQVVSQQLIDQSGVDFDQVVTADLAAAYAANVGNQIMMGTGTGANNNAVINGLYAATVPAGNQAALAANFTAAQFYSKASGLIASFVTARFANPTHWLMHPRRWYWLLSLTDNQGRPLVIPTAPAMNPIAEASHTPAASGVVGTLLGLPVVIDPQHPTNLGTGTNEDRIWLIKADDLWMFESDPVAEVFRQPYADTLGVLFRLYSYAGTILNRMPASLAYISGATAPSF